MAKRGRGSQCRNNTARLFNEQGGKCFYCDEEMFLRKGVKRSFVKRNRAHLATFDHIKLNKDGGTYALTNGVCACHKCNLVRGDLPQDLFIENFKFIMEEWDKGNRRHTVVDGAVLCVTTRKAKLIANGETRRYRSTLKGAFLAARFAIQIGETVEDLFLKFVYNNTYEQARDL